MISLKRLTSDTIYTISLQALTSNQIGSDVYEFNVSTLAGERVRVLYHGDYFMIYHSGKQTQRLLNSLVKIFSCNHENLYTIVFRKI